jgi:hypothetical protein
MTVTTNDRGQQNMWATEPAMYMTKEDLDRYGMGFVAAVVSYATTGSLFFFGAFGI